MIKNINLVYTIFCYGIKFGYLDNVIIFLSENLIV